MKQGKKDLRDSVFCKKKLATTQSEKYKSYQIYIIYLINYFIFITEIFGTFFALLYVDAVKGPSRLNNVRWADLT